MNFVLITGIINFVAVAVASAVVGVSVAIAVLVPPRFSFSGPFLIENFQQIFMED